MRAENTTDGWRLQTSPKHYHCPKVHVKKMNSEQILDTVFFKHRYITQPTVTPADILTKAIDDLAATLKQQRSTDGIKEMEALRKLNELLKLDELLNQNSPATTTMPNPMMERTTTAVSNPRVEGMTVTAPTSRVEGTTAMVPAPRVDTSIQVPQPREAITTQKPMPDIRSPTKPKELPPERAKVRELIHEKINQHARIPWRHQMDLCNTE
jgi:hypothetical protein